MSPSKKRDSKFIAATLASVMFFLLLTAWFHIQTVRWGYKVENMRMQIERLKKQDQIVNERLENALSLARLDELGKTRFSLRAPQASQVIFLIE